MTVQLHNIFSVLYIQYKEYMYNMTYTPSDLNGKIPKQISVIQAMLKYLTHYVFTEYEI